MKKFLAGLFVIALSLVLSTTSGAGEGTWTMLGNGPAHTGYTPVSLGGGTFNPGWTKKLGDKAANAVVVANGRVFATSGWYFNDSFYVAAFDETNGNQAWRYDFADANSISPPSFDSNAIYVQRCNHTPDTHLWKFNAATGQVIWSAPIEAQWETYLAPTIADNVAWINGGYYGGMYGVNTPDGSRRFFNDDLEQYDEWAPAYSNGRLFSYVEGKLRQHSPTTGVILWTLDLDWNWWGWSMETAPVVEGNFAYVYTDHDSATSYTTLYAVNLTTHQVAWQSNGFQFAGVAATAKNVLYAITNNSVRAYAADTGAFIRTYQADVILKGQPIVTNDTLIVSGQSDSYPNPAYTYIFDLATGQLLQKIAAGGEISLAGPSLYIATPDGFIKKFALAPPTVSSFTPNSGPTAGGTAFSIAGQNFGNAGVRVTFDGIDATNIVATSTTITGKTPPHAAGNATVAVITGVGTSANVGTFAFIPPPAVTGFTPGNGSTLGGTTVTINGSGFLPGAIVSFGSTTAASLTVVNSTQITAVTPAAPVGTVTIKVVNPDAQQTTSTGTFRFIAPPTVASVSPNSGTSNGGGTVVVSGSGFLAGVSVSFGGTAATTVSVISESQLICVVPPRNYLQVGAVNVTVTNFDAQSATLTNGYTYTLAVPPVLGTVSPSVGSTVGGTFVSLTGSGFVPGTTATIGGKAFVNGKYVQADAYTGSTPASNIGSVTIILSNPDGQVAVDVDGFTFMPPQVSTVSPASGSTNGGTALTLTGAYFIPGAAVLIGGTAATNVVVVSDTQISCVTPARKFDLDGPVDVIVRNTDNKEGVRVKGFTYERAPQPTVSGVSPSLAVTSGGSSATVMGTNFVAGSTVRVGGAAATAVVVNSASEIACKLPAHAPGAVAVEVTNPDGQVGTLDGAVTYFALLTLSSGPTAAPNPTRVGETVQFSAAAALDGATLAWDFGDGTASSEASPSHVYMAAGTYSAKVTATHGPSNQAITVAVSVVVNVGVGEFGRIDSDGDGFPDEVEIAMNSSPVNVDSRPMSLEMLEEGAESGLSITKKTVKLAFTKPGTDAISLNGTLSVPNGFAPSGVVVVIDFGGVIQAFTLDKRGGGKANASTLSLKAKAVKGVVSAQAAKLAIKLSKGSYGSLLADDGLTGEAGTRSVFVPLWVAIDGTSYSVDVPLSYTAKAGKSGSAK